MAILKDVTIGDCRLILPNRKRERARGHKQALKLFPVIGPCVKCGKGKAERHHIDDNPLNNAPENIMALCRRCHTIEHGKRPTEEAMAVGRKEAAQQRRAISHCPSGHEYAGDNLYITPDGRRVCRACNLVAKRKYRAGGGRG